MFLSLLLFFIISWGISIYFMCLLWKGVLKLDISLIVLPIFMSCSAYFLVNYNTITTTYKYALINRIDNDKYIECINNKKYLIYVNVSAAHINNGESCIDRLYSYKEKSALEKIGFEFVVYNKNDLFRDPEIHPWSYAR